MVFMAIWWAWMGFTWFASSFDTDDAAYRLKVLVQMIGVLVLAAGVSRAFNNQDFRLITIGYAIMRVGLVAQWLRAARADVAVRKEALRYAIGISVLQPAAPFLGATAIPAAPFLGATAISSFSAPQPRWARQSPPPSITQSAPHM